MNKFYSIATTNNEYSGTEISCMLNNFGVDGLTYRSHETVILNLYDLLNYIKMIKTHIITDKLVIIKEQSNSIKSKNHYNYQHRPVELESTCFYNFLSFFKVINKSRNVFKNDNIWFYLDKNHKDYNYKIIMYNKQHLIPILLCPSIPRKNDVNKKSLYQLIILLLFKPWVSLSEFAISDKNLELIYNNFIESLLINKNDSIINYINNIEFMKKSDDDAINDRLDYNNMNNGLYEQQVKLNNLDYVPDDMELLDNTSIDNCLELDNNQHIINFKKDALFLWCQEGSDVINNLPKYTKNNNFNFDTRILNIVDYNNNTKLIQWKNEYKELNKLNIIKNSYLDVKQASLISDSNILYNKLKNKIINKYKLDFQQKIMFELFIEPIINNNLEQRIIPKFRNGEIPFCSESKNKHYHIIFAANKENDKFMQFF